MMELQLHEEGKKSRRERGGRRGRAGLEPRADLGKSLQEPKEAHTLHSGFLREAST